MEKTSENKLKKFKVFLDTNHDLTKNMKLTSYEWG